MKPFNRLIKSKIYHLTKLQNKLYGEVDEYLQKNNLSKKDFAEELGVSKGYVSQVLNGGFDHKLSKMFEISIAINKIPHIQFLETEEYKKLELSKRMENIPLDLTELQESYQKRNHCNSFDRKEVHKESPLMELGF